MADHGEDVDYFINGNGIKWGGGAGLTGTMGVHFNMISDRLTYVAAGRMSAPKYDPYDLDMGFASSFKMTAGDFAITTAVPFLRINGKAVWETRCGLLKIPN